MLAPLRGSVSAEHGIGSLKREFLPVSRSAEELAVMKAVKRALDPNGILNPGKLF
jgi:FAD/FMN-containing dehydrogenase